MRFGLSLLRVPIADFVPITEHAERVGFESAWLSEHMFFTERMDDSPYPGAENPSVRGTVPMSTPSPFQHLVDPTTCLAFLAGRTERIRFGTYVYLAGLRHPLITARTFQTLDHFSGGRALLGVGSGWLRGEFRALGLDWESRGRRLDETIAVCRRLWTEKLVEHRGEFYQFEPVAMEPKPVQQPIPVHIGGETLPALRRAVRLGDGWLAMEHTPRSFAASRRRLAEVAEQEGRDISHLEITVTANLRDRDEIDEWRALGVHRIIVTPWAPGGDRVAAIDAFASRHGLAS